MNNVQKLEQLQQATHGPRSARRVAYRKLGHLESDLGFPATGLEDVLRAYALLRDKTLDLDRLAAMSLQDLLAQYVKKGEPFPVDETPFELAAQLGEGFRLYARDVDFSEDSADLSQTVETMQRSVRCFDHAVEKCSTDRVEQHAWVLAHRGAARTMGYWLKQTLGTTAGGTVFGAGSITDLFGQAKRDFDAALRLRPNYPWCRRFLAFLHTLEGSDFEKACSQLEQARPNGEATDSSLERSMALLFLNLAGQSPETEKERAKQALASATEAMRQNPEEFMASYCAAASMSILAQGSAATSQTHRSALAAIASARLRSNNAVSQAYATLIALSVLESALSCSCAKAAEALSGTKAARPDHQETAELCQRYVMWAQKVKPDLETRVVFDREILRLKKLKDVDPELREQLGQFLDNFRPQQVTASTAKE